MSKASELLEKLNEAAGIAKVRIDKVRYAKQLAAEHGYVLDKSVDNKDMGGNYQSTTTHYKFLGKDYKLEIKDLKDRTPYIEWFHYGTKAVESGTGDFSLSKYLDKLHDKK